MKRHLVTLVAAILCLVGFVQITSAQPGPVGPATNVNQNAGVTPQGIADLLRKSAKKVEVKQERDSVIVTANVNFDYEGKPGNAIVAVVFAADRIGLASSIQKTDTLTQAQIADLLRMEATLPEGQKYVHRNGVLMVGSEIRRAPNQISEAELVRHIELMLGTVARTNAMLDGQKAAPAPVAPQTNPTPAPEAPKAPATAPQGAPPIEVIKAKLEDRFLPKIAYKNMKVVLTYESIHVGTPFQRALPTVGGGYAKFDMFPVTVKLQILEQFPDGVERTTPKTMECQFFMSGGKWTAYLSEKN